MMQPASTTATTVPSTRPLAAVARHRLRTTLLALGMAAAAAVPAGLTSSLPARAASFDAAAAEAQLVAATNADRAQAGLPALVVNPTLGAIARSAPISVCGTTVNGRSQDMLDRSYFSHQVPPCNSYVWPALAAAGVQVTAAGENIGWNNTAPQSASVDQVNTAFMNSPGHRANIMGAFNQVGIGAAMAAAPWSSNGVSYSGVVMYTVIFAMGPLPAAPPPSGPPATTITSTSTQGYNILTAGGAIYSFGDATYHGNLIDHGYPGPAVGLSETRDAGGYNILTTAGAIYSFGNARYFGNLLDHNYPGPAVALSHTPSGNGYAILTSVGALYTFGDAPYFGNLIDHGYPGRAVSVAYTPSGRGYSILTDAGAIYSFGDAAYFGNLLDHGYPGVAVALAPTNSGGGYSILTTAGAIYSFGDATYYGNLLDHRYPGPAVSLSPTP
ncbi:MAG: hypothetical protein NVSMB17_08870 [Candidatus Dormibacteria bacterium]